MLCAGSVASALTALLPTSPAPYPSAQAANHLCRASTESLAGSRKPLTAALQSPAEKLVLPLR